MSKILRLALEEISDGKAFHEIEVVIYGRVVDLSDLQKASSIEHHSQWEIKLPKTDSTACDGRIRVRKTIPHISSFNNQFIKSKDTDSFVDAEATYALTTKVATDIDTRIEVSTPSSKDQHKQFMLLAPGGMLKDRYEFLIPNSDLKFEVDMFYQPGANVGERKYHEWCKIDVEVPSKPDMVTFNEMLNSDKVNLPIQLSDIIVDLNDDNLTKEEKDAISNLYENYFITKNRFVG